MRCVTHSHSHMMLHAIGVGLVADSVCVSGFRANAHANVLRGN